MTGYGNYIKKIEQRENLEVFQSGRNEARNQKTFSNRKLFAWYFILILIVWIIIFTVNIFKLWNSNQ